VSLRSCAIRQLQAQLERDITVAFQNSRGQAIKAGLVRRDAPVPHAGGVAGNQPLPTRLNAHSSICWTNAASEREAVTCTIPGTRRNAAWAMSPLAMAGQTTSQESVTKFHRSRKSEANPVRLAFGETAMAWCQHRQ